MCKYLCKVQPICVICTCTWLRGLSARTWVKTPAHLGAGWRLQPFHRVLGPEGGTLRVWFGQWRQRPWGKRPGRAVPGHGQTPHPSCTGHLLRDANVTCCRSRKVTLGALHSLPKAMWHPRKAGSGGKGAVVSSLHIDHRFRLECRGATVGTGKSSAPWLVCTGTSRAGRWLGWVSRGQSGKRT